METLLKLVFFVLFSFVVMAVVLHNATVPTGTYSQSSASGNSVPTSGNRFTRRVLPPTYHPAPRYSAPVTTASSVTSMESPAPERSSHTYRPSTYSTPTYTPPAYSTSTYVPPSTYVPSSSYTPPSTYVPDVDKIISDMKENEWRYYRSPGPGTGSNPVDVSVGGYYRSNGTYVAPYHRTAGNNTTLDNYSTAPNYNPYTGRTGRRH